MELNLYAPIPPHDIQRDKLGLYNHGVSNLDSMEATKRIKVTVREDQQEDLSGLTEGSGHRVCYVTACDWTA
jgi:hypothetical protein